jgi:hypothetical protein
MSKQLDPVLEQLKKYLPVGFASMGLSLDLDLMKLIPTEVGVRGGKATENTATATAAESFNIPLYLFGSRLTKKKVLVVQVCDMREENIFEFFRKAKIGSTWHMETGWYHADTLKILRQRVVRTLIERIEQFMSVPFDKYDNYDYSSKDSMSKSTSTSTFTSTSTAPKTLTTKGSPSMYAAPTEEGRAIVLNEESIGFPVEQFEWLTKYQEIDLQVSNK